MARPLRVLYEGAYYHVMNRGRSRRPIFYDDKDYMNIISIIKGAMEHCNANIVAYCMMKNHYHLILHTPDANLSQCMRQINGVYTQIFNRRYNKDGSLFRGRYKAIIVQEEKYLMRLIRYVHLNPTNGQHGRKCQEYPWSSYGHYLKDEENTWLKYQGALAQITGDYASSKKMLAQEMDKGLDPEIEGFLNSKKKAFILGDEDFKDFLNEKDTQRGYYEMEVPERVKMMNEKKYKKIMKEVKKQFQVTTKEMMVSKRGQTNESRHMAIALVKECTQMRLRDIAKKFHIASYKTVYKTYTSFAERRLANSKLSQIYQGIKKRMYQGET
jgi:putative transposase